MIVKVSVLIEELCTVYILISDRAGIESMSEWIYEAFLRDWRSTTLL